MRKSGSTLKFCAAFALVAMVCGVAASQAQESRKLIAQTQPEYNDLAKHLRLTGTVKIQVVIGTDGIIKNTKVVGGNPVLVESTLEALKKWKYAPSSSETTTMLEFNFRPPS